MTTLFTPYLVAWSLVVDGPAITTPAASLLPVRYQGQPAMLKISTAAEEQAGYDVLQWWAGDGAVHVLARDGAALLMERAAGGPAPSTLTTLTTLTTLSAQGRDADATAILCSTIARLHAPRAAAKPALVPLPAWFTALTAQQRAPGSVLQRAQCTAQALLADPQGRVCLHGDVHHGNVVDGGPRGWQAIDPKGLLGERGFDYANLFCNPNSAIACDPQRFAARVAAVSAWAQLDRKRLLQWILAWAGLSAAWHAEDGTPAEVALQVAALAAAALDAA